MAHSEISEGDMMSINVQK